MQKNNLANLISDNLKNRDSERLITKFDSQNQYAINFIKHSSENGVIRNGGRRGSSFAPEAILNVFKKMANHQSNSFNEVEVANPILENNDFTQAQVEEAKKIYESIKTINSSVHLFLGGGHDHIYPDLLAIEKNHPDKKLVIINIDPHLDMRTDEFKNSGTPFRQFDQSTINKHRLIQIGTHDFANVKSSLVPTKNIDQKIISFSEACGTTENFTQVLNFLRLNFKASTDVVYVVSLDVDAIDSSIMEAVSAVNHHGLPLSFVAETLKYFKNELNCQYFGFYEYNPIFDNLSQKGSRALASLIYSLI